MTIIEFIKSAAIIVLICTVFGLAAFGLNFYTQPLIDANNAGAWIAPLIEVLPSGKDFKSLMSGAVPENVKQIYVETNGAGYVFEVTATGYQAGLVIRVGIDSEGKIAGSSVVSSNETWGHETLLNGAYNGQTIDTAELIIASGASENSATSNGYFNAINTALQAYTILTGGKLDPAKVIEGIIPGIHTGICNGETILGDAVAPSGSIVKGWNSTNGSGSVYIMKKGDDAYVAVVNASGYVQIFDAEAKLVTEDHKDLLDEAKAKFGTVGTTVSKAVIRKITKLYGDEVEDSIERLDITTFNTVALAVRFTDTEGNTVYLVQSKPYTYANNVMTVYTYIDDDGKIIKQDVATLIYDHYSVPGYESSSSEAYVEWLEKYEGKTNTELGDDLLISGATLSSTAVRKATADAFAAFESIKGGAQ